MKEISISSVIKIISIIILLFGFFIVTNLFLYKYKGDVNHDDKVSSIDIIYIQRYLHNYDDNLSLWDLYCMDMDCDFKITNNDIYIIQKKIVELNQ